MLATVDDQQRDFDVTFVAVRREQFATAFSSLTSSGVHGDVLLFGNTAGLTVVGQFGTPHWFLRLRGGDAETGDDGRFDGYDGVGVVDPRME